jgi:hypothetical protein
MPHPELPQKVTPHPTVFERVLSVCRCQKIRVSQDNFSQPMIFSGQIQKIFHHAAGVIQHIFQEETPHRFKTISFCGVNGHFAFGFCVQRPGSAKPIVIPAQRGFDQLFFIPAFLDEASKSRPNSGVHPMPLSKGWRLGPKLAEMLCLRL